MTKRKNKLGSRAEHKTKEPATILRSATLRVELNLSDPNEIKALADAFTPETYSGQRCKLSVEETGSSSSLRKGRRLRTRKTSSGLVLNFVSEDLTSLRASLNTNLRLASSAISALNALREHPKTSANL